MKNKIIYAIVLVLSSTLFFFIGWYTQKLQQENISESQVLNQPDPGPMFDYFQPHLFLTSSECEPTNTPDWYVCVSQLADKTTAEADALAVKLSQGAGEMSQKIQQVQKNIQSYIDAFCDLDGMLVQGGTGTGLEVEACRNYYASSYLKLLRSLENPETVRSSP